MRPRQTTLPLLLGVMLVTPLLAKENDPDVHLSWSPQQHVATTRADVTGDMMRNPVDLEIVDERGLEDVTELGTRTDDADREYTLRSLDDVTDFVRRSAATVLADWGVEVRAGAARTLKLSLLRFRVTESNQPVGATYEARCRFEARLEDAGGSFLWEGEATGDATRYGRKFSEANISEVLSDALLEALGELVSEGDLHRAWAGGATAANTAAGGPVIAPDALLAEVRRLADEGVGAEQLVRFVSGRRLSRALDADDLLAWRDAGLPDAVVNAVLDLPVR